MNELPNRRHRDLENPFEGCMGKMINIFDLSAGMAGNKLLTDKAHRDGSPVRRNRSDLVKKPKDPVRAHVDDRTVTTNDVRKSSPSKKSSSTPIKMLIAQEMLKETESKRKQPSIVARLMGLDDAVPVQQPAPTPRSKSAGSFRGRRQPEDIYFDRPRAREIHSCSHEKEYKDIYAIRQEPSSTTRSRDHAPLKERFDENQNKKRMALVRQKFIEAKRLATDEKLLQSKEFQDALEVLSSNRDLFLKFLEEPNSLFSKHSKELHEPLAPPHTNRITLLKPSKTVEPKVEQHVERKQYRPSDFSQPKADKSSQPTRIVVLKPSPARTREVKAMTTTPMTSPEQPHHTNFYRGFEASEAVGSREIAKEITRHMRESVSSHRRDESLLSSVLSNGYIGDDSSFDKSENEYIEEDAGIFSDTEITSPASRNSWEYNNRIGSPYSLSSFSRASYSPESSVVREAKKRLSERWALSQDQMQVWRSSSTLGEMLALPEVKNEETSNGGLAVSSNRSYGGEEELTATFSRSQSVPVSSSAYENIELQIEASGSQIKKSITPKEATKSKSGKSSFKGKVSSFFSRNKKSGKQNSVSSSPLAGSDDRIQFDSPVSESVHDSSREESLLVNSEEKASKDGPRKGAFSSKVAIYLEKPRTAEHTSKNQGKLGPSVDSIGNQDQPSPTSVLDASFEDDAHSNASPSSKTVLAGHPQALSRSAPIESVARSLSWDETLMDLTSPDPSKIRRGEDEEKQWFAFIQYLLSHAGLDSGRVDPVFTGWHSPESPLDPGVLSKILDRKEEGAKSRERRSSQRLLFDCVNAALLGAGHAALVDAYPWAGTPKHGPTGALVEAEVWSLVKGWFSREEGRASCEADSNSLGVDRMLRKEVAGSGWATELVRMEVEEVCRDIGGKVLEELVGEALSDFSSEYL